MTTTKHTTYDHKCNRCGHVETTDRESPPRNYRQNWAFIKAQGGVEGPRYNSDGYDLCHECAKDFDEFLKEGGQRKQ